MEAMKKKTRDKQWGGGLRNTWQRLIFFLGKDYFRISHNQGGSPLGSEQAVLSWQIVLGEHPRHVSKISKKFTVLPVKFASI